MLTLKDIIPYLLIAVMAGLILKMTADRSKLKCEDAQKQTIIEVIKDDNKTKQETERKINNLDRDKLLAYGSSAGIMRKPQDY